MSGTKALRLRIKSIKSTQKITKAMQMVAASKLRKAKEAMENNVPYYDTIKFALHRIAKKEDDLSFLQKLAWRSKEDAKKVLAVIITSERGLCGGFNQSILRFARNEIDRMKAEGKEVKISIIGKKGRPFLSARYGDNIILLKHPNPPKLEFAFARGLSNEVLALLEKEGFDSCKIYFSHFKNAVVQIPNAKTLMSIMQEGVTEQPDEGEYECEGVDLTDTAIKMYIEAEIHKALLESRASEEAARMVAMDNATKNASEMIDKLTLVMNRTRQATITKELIEIISGAEAV